MIMFYMVPRRMVLKKHEIQEFRGIAEGLVGESGIDVDFPSETPPARGMKVVGWILALSMLGLLGIAVHVICLLGFKAEESLVVIGSWMLLFLPVLLLWTVGVGVWSYLFRRYQDKLWLELGDLLDIADEATIALHEQNRSDIAAEIKRVERLVKKYRRYGVQNLEKLSWWSEKRTVKVLEWMENGFLAVREIGKNTLTSKENQEN